MSLLNDGARLGPHTAVIVQARMASTRLPGKVLLPMADGTPVLKRVVDRVREAYVYRVIVATSMDEADRPIWEACVEWGVDVFTWPNVDDVLGRFAAVLRVHPEIERIVRITADCPFVDPAVIMAVLKEHHIGRADYTSNVHERTYPDGFDVEVFSPRLLNWLDAHLEDDDPRREHVIAASYKDAFWASVRHVRRPGTCRNLSKWRFTLDTRADYFKLGYLDSLFDRPVYLDDVVKAVELGLVTA